jgi:hypothetical protein
MRARHEWVLFDDRGATRTARSIGWKPGLSRLPDDGDLATGLIRYLGFVGGRRLGSNAAVRLHRHGVSQVALAAAFYWLADHDPARVLIDFVGESRPAEVCRSAAGAIARLVELTRTHDSNRIEVEAQRSLDQIAAGAAGSPFTGLLGNPG